MSSDYPKFNGMHLGVCRLSAGAEFMLNKSTSFLPAVSILNNSFSAEVRKYVSMKSDNPNPIQGFVSSRISTRHRVSLGFGAVDSAGPFFLTPVFGVAYDLKNEKLAPFLSVSFGIL